MICAVKERAQSRSADKWSVTQSMGTRRAVSAVREERAHVMEQFIHLLRCLPLRSGRSSSAGLVAPDRTFRAAETPGGSHNGSQPNAARVTAPVRSPRHSHVPWLHAPTSPGTSPHAQARPILALTASHLVVAERFDFGVLGEPAAQDGLRDLLPDGRGQR